MRLFLIRLLPLIFAVLPLGCSFPAKIQSIQRPLIFTSLGNPLEKKPEAARRVSTLKIFKNRLYVGHGNAVANTGPTDVISMDLETRQFRTEFTVDDEAIFRFREIDGKLVIPGVDATEDWQFGNVYVLGDNGWRKERSVPRALHILDVVALGNQWYAGTGSVFNLGKQEDIPFGGIYRSEDEGKTWSLSYATSSDANCVYRISSMVPFQGKLYAFIYANIGLATQEVPEKNRASLKELDKGQYLVYVNDPLGVEDAFVFDGKRWTVQNLAGVSDICTVSGYAFRDKLLLSVLSGKYLDASRPLDTLPAGAATRLYAYDGHTAKLLPVKCDIMRGAVMNNLDLCLLLVRGQRFYIAKTSDLATWDYFLLPEDLKPTAFEYDGRAFYIGTKDGEILHSAEIIQ